MLNYLWEGMILIGIHLDKELNGAVNHIELGYITGKISYNKQKAV